VSSFVHDCLFDINGLKYSLIDEKGTSSQVFKVEKVKFAPKQNATVFKQISAASKAIFSLPKYSMPLFKAEVFNNEKYTQLFYANKFRLHDEPSHNRKVLN